MFVGSTGILSFRLMIYSWYVAAAAWVPGQDEDLAWIHDVSWVKRPFHRPLEIDMIFAMLCYYVANLTDANPMLAGDGTFVTEGSINHPVLELQHLPLPVRLVGNAAVKVAIGNVRTNDAREIVLGEIFFSLGNHSSYVGDRHASVGNEHLISFPV